MSKLLFPHENIRSIQQEVIDVIAKQIENKRCAVIHAPTGLGKTAASIAPALTYALEHNKTVYFLTSKNTQHKIAVDTVRAIKERHQKDIQGTDIVGKKWMCIQPGVNLLSTNEFNEYCRTLREDHKCEFFENLKNGEELSPKTKSALAELKTISPTSIEQLLEIGKDYKLCPYELGMLLAKNANIVITDYYYLFHPKIRSGFLKKSEKSLDDAIIIVDEGHNLPDRIKDLASANLSTLLLTRAINEATKHGHEEIADILTSIQKLLGQMIAQDEEEKYLEESDFTKEVDAISQYDQLIKECETLSENIREEQKQSAIGSVGNFLEEWLGSNKGFTRIISRKKGTDQILLSYRCLDPSIIAKEVLENAHAVILMSGTLTPTKMYNELLGFELGTIQETYKSPFPEENRLNLIVAKTSTKFTKRSEEQYKEIATVITDVINATPGNSVIFFPSYYMKEIVKQYLRSVEKTVFEEHQQMSKAEKEEMIGKFRTYKDSGAALLAVVAGSFGEGIDLPGDELKTVVVVGLPLTKPDLEVKALIDYYEGKFKNGWNYGYVYPAFNKVIQNAGRCIRSETDRGVVVFLDERFTWPRYYNCFPSEWKMKVSVNGYKEKIEKFFGKKDTSSQATLFPSVDDI